ncbi:glycoside hydrolase family 9 protein [Cohnella soli]|uniref:Glycoside hydrolase family 9 protein n=1 Tax=Cohnella soli TaxID=425005 RepID=A0ABW0HZU2_9BACL
MLIKRTKRTLFTLLLTSALTIGTLPPLQSNAAAPSVAVQKYMMVDQFGYLPTGDKVAVLADPQEGFNAADAYTPGSVLQVRRVRDDKVVFTGAPQAWNNGATEPFSGDRGWWFDFSSVMEEGDFYIYDVQGNCKSNNFRIAGDVYQDVLKAAIKTFYYQRIGTPHLAEHAGAAYADGAAFVGPHQDTQARNVFDRNNPTTERDLSGGWMDAGDFNKYVTYTAQPVNELLSAYERQPGAFSDDYNIPESGNGIPDVLDEVKWELDWLKKMQESDGGVLMKVGVPSSGGIGEFSNPPSTITRYRYYLPKTSASTVVTSLNFAHAALVYGQFPTLKGYADDLRERAIRAWDWYQANPKTDNADKGEIEAGDADMPLANQAQVATTAAAYLFALTGEAKYNTYFINNYKTIWPMSDGYWGMYYGEQADGVMFYTTLPNADPAVKAYILERRDVQDFDERFNDNDDLYRSYVPGWAYHWGSLQVRARLGASAYDFVQYDLNPSKRDNYDKRAQNSLHYFHGVNPLSSVYLTNMGVYGAENSISQIYHSWFADRSPWDIAPPGYVPGGPSMQYSGTASPPLGQPRQKMYKDWNGIAWDWPRTVDASWEITENGIYYQAAYIKLLAKFVPAAPLPTAPPVAPTGETAIAAGTTSILFKWNKAAGAAAYDIEVDGVVKNNGPSVSYTHEGLEPGTTHVYRVKARNGLGASEWSAPSEATTEVPPPPPKTPSDVTATATNSFSTELKWNAMTGATSYEVEADGVVKNIGNLTSIVYKGLASASTHSYRVKATNSGGESAWSEPMKVTTPKAPPTSEIDLSHNGTAGYTFGQASDQVKRYQTFVADAYPELTGVDVNIRKGGLPGNVTVELYATSDDKPIGSALASATIASSAVTDDGTIVRAPLKFSGLTYGTKYAIVLGQATGGTGGIYEWLTGIDVNGQLNFGKFMGDAWVDESHIGYGWMKLYVAQSAEPQPQPDPDPQAQPPAVPTGAKASAASAASIAVSWNAVKDAAAYEIEADGSAAYAVTNTPAFVHSGLAAGSKHTYRIRAINSAGAGEWTSPISAVTTQASSSNVIDVSHQGTDGFMFGETRDQVKRYQTFVANANNTMTRIEVNVRKFNNPSNLTASLYATKNNKPTGSALATATVKASAISEDYEVIDIPLTYTGLGSGATYAIVLSQSKTSDYAGYEWLTSEVSGTLKFGKYSSGAWVDESAIGDGWLKVYVK